MKTILISATIRSQSIQKITKTNKNCEGDVEKATHVMDLWNKPLSSTNNDSSFKKARKADKAKFLSFSCVQPRWALDPLLFPSSFFFVFPFDKCRDSRSECICTMYTKRMNLFIYIKQEITAEPTKVKALVPDIASRELQRKNTPFLQIFTTNIYVVLLCDLELFLAYRSFFLHIFFHVCTGDQYSFF